MGVWNREAGGTRLESGMSWDARVGRCWMFNRDAVLVNLSLGFFGDDESRAFQSLRNHDSGGDEHHGQEDQQVCADYRLNEGRVAGLRT